MIVRCPRCGQCASAHYRTGLAPDTSRCEDCGLTFPFFPALEIETIGTLPRLARGLAEPAHLPAADSPRKHPACSRTGVQRAWGWAGRTAALVAGLLLILTLFGQFLVHERARLAVYPEFRVLGDQLCSRLPCPPQGTRHPAAIHVELFGFIDRPPNHLRVELELHNTLDRPQPWPLLQLALSDRHGRVLGQGRWHPAQYLDPPIGTAASIAWLQPGERHRLRLEVAAPGRTVDGVMIWPL